MDLHCFVMGLSCRFRIKSLIFSIYLNAESLYCSTALQKIVKISLVVGF